MNSRAQEKKWPIEIFRYSIDGGWELYQQKQTKQDEQEQQQQQQQPQSKKGGKVASSGKTTATTAKQQNQNNDGSHYTKNSNSDFDDDEGVTVVPRYGCIEVKKLRLRIHLFKTTAKDNYNNNVRNNKNRKNTKKREANTTVVRRRDTILFTNQHTKGAVVLKFRSVAKCMGFSDRLVELNADYIFNQTDDKLVQRPLKRPRKVATNSSSNANYSNRTSSANGANGANVAASSNNDGGCGSGNNNNDNDGDAGGTEAIRSYMVRLLHDEDFLGFVDNVEHSLASAPDTSKILEALAYVRRGTST